MSNGEHSERLRAVEVRDEAIMDRLGTVEGKVDTLVALVTDMRISSARTAGIAATVAFLTSALVAPLVVALVAG